MKNAIGDSASMENADDLNSGVRVELDWAKGPEIKLTSGGMAMISGTVVKHMSKNQALRSLSMAESEHDAVVAGAAGVLPTQA